METWLSQAAVKTARGPAVERAPGRLRVLHLINNFEAGGTERQAVELLKRLDRARFDVRLAALHCRGPLYAELAGQYPAPEEFPLNRFYSAGALRQCWRLRAGLRREAIDILHTHDFYAGWLGTLAALGTGVRVIASQRHLRLSERWVHDCGRRVINRLAQRVLVNSELIRQHVLANGLADAHKIVVIHNGLAFNPASENRLLMRAALRHELHLPAHAQLVGTVANLRPVKGHRYLLEAAAEVLQKFPNTHFILVGEGELRAALAAQAAALGISAHVHLLGQRLAAAQLAQAFDLAVLASLHEGMPNTVMEAMAAGVPVVCTAVGGALELIEDGVTGWLAPPADAAGLALKIMRALAAEDASTQVGQRGRAFVLERFDPLRMVAATERLYEELGAARDVTVVQP